MRPTLLADKRTIPAFAGLHRIPLRGDIGPKSLWGHFGQMLLHRDFPAWYKAYRKNTERTKVVLPDRCGPTTATALNWCDSSMSCGVASRKNTLKSTIRESDSGIVLCGSRPSVPSTEWSCSPDASVSIVLRSAMLEQQGSQTYCISVGSIGSGVPHRNIGTQTAELHGSAVGSHTAEHP